MPQIITAIQIKNDNPYDGKIDQTVTQDPTLYKSQLGTPVLTDLTLKGGKYLDNAGRVVSFEDVVLVNFLIQVSQTKHIVTTEIPGLDGTIKEYIGMDDYEVVITGAINGANGSYPLDAVNTLYQLLKASVPVEVVSDYLKNLDIYELVIKEFKLGQEAGGYSSQEFALTCLSETPSIIQMM